MVEDSFLDVYLAEIEVYWMVPEHDSEVVVDIAFTNVVRSCNQPFLFGRNVANAIVDSQEYVDSLTSMS